MNHDPATEMTFIATSDLAAVMKGRSMRTEDFHAGSTVGWVPANLGIGIQGHIAEDLPFGSTGDLRLKPDLSTRRTVTGVPGRPDLDFVMADVVKTDGSPYECCPRTFLRQVLADLHQEYGINVVAGWEHEFADLDADYPHHPFSFRSFRCAEPMGSQLFSALARSGLGPDTWLPEYGDHQFEITLSPVPALEGADRAVLLREIVRDVYRVHGHRATFTPVPKLGGSGSGVHVHFSLSDDAGRNVSWDPSRPGRVSAQVGSFLAGILRDSADMCALFAPLSISYQRLVPNNWSSARVFLGLQDREALLRIVPTVEIGGKDPEPQLHFEFRAADAGANPWLFFGALMRAGLDGLRDGLEPAAIVERELDLKGRDKDLPALPSTLEEALDLFESSERARGWFCPDMVRTFLSVKREEVDQMNRLSLQERCEIYASVY